MKNLNVPKNDKERNIFQNVLKRSQKINVNVQNSKAAVLFQHSRHDATIYVYISHLIQLNEAIRTKKDVLNSNNYFKKIKDKFEQKSYLFERNIFLSIFEISKFS
jgi:hypothetical protein